MTQHDHPPLDVLADLVEGLLPADQALAVNAHVAGCAECRDQRTSLEDVRAVLQEEGARAIPMPAQVTGRLDAALAAANLERATGVGHPGVVSLEERAAARRRTRRGRFLLAGAAACSIIAAVGFALSLSDVQQDDDMGAAGGGAESADEDGRDVPTDALSPTTRVDDAVADALRRQAAELAAEQGPQRGLVSPDAVACLDTALPGYADDWPTRRTTFEGSLAWLAVAPDDSRAWVVACEPAPTVLIELRF